MSDDLIQLKMFVEAAVLASEHPLTIDQLKQLFDENDRPTTEVLRNILATLAADCSERGIELVEVASGFRYQVKAEYGQKINKLFEERPPRYTRAFLETLALIAYRQPITRGEIEDIRGVAVSTNIIKTLVDREWVRVVGYRDVPGRPGLYATTRQFLDYFNLKSLEQLPSLVELQNIDVLANKIEGENPELQHLSEDGVHQRDVHVQLANEQDVHEQDILVQAVHEHDAHNHNIHHEDHHEHNVHERDSHELNICQEDVHELNEHQKAVQVNDHCEQQNSNLAQDQSIEEEDDYIEIVEPVPVKNEDNQFEDKNENEPGINNEQRFQATPIDEIEVNEEYQFGTISEDNLEIIEENVIEFIEENIIEVIDKKKWRYY